MTRVERRTIGWGDRGTMDTLALMAQLVNRGVDSPLVISSARQLAASAGDRDPFRQALAVRQFLARVWRFVDDPPDRELLRDPDAMMHEYFELGAIMGDCDEAAVLGAALGKAIGMEATFTVLSFPVEGGGDQFGHVFTSLLTPDGKTLELDVTRPAGPVPQAIRTLSVEV